MGGRERRDGCVNLKKIFLFQLKKTFLLKREERATAVFFKL